MSKRRFVLFILTIVLTMSMMTVSTMAMGIDYSQTGRLDDFSGLTLEEDVSSTVNWIKVTPTMMYDPLEQVFVFSAEGSAQRFVRSSVADEMITTESVTIIPDDGIEVKLYHDGIPLDIEKYYTVEEAGKYVVLQTTGSSMENRLFEFTIVNELTGQISSYMLPSGFYISRATLDGNNVNCDRSYIGFSEEGEYDVHYYCSKTDESYELNFVADFTAPVLTLDGVEDGIAKGPVTISGLEEGDVMGIQLNGSRIVTTNVVDKSGDYVIKVADEAGNINTYQFTIRLYLDRNSLFFILIVILIIVGTGAYILLSRKRLRVR